MPPVIDPIDLVKSLQSTRCPICGKRKQSGHTMCGKDYGRLPTRMRKALYNRLGEGYEDAVSDAMHRLGAVEFIMPKS